MASQESRSRARAPRPRPKHSDCKYTADKFFTYLNSSTHSKVSSRDELRNIFYDDFKATLGKTDRPACNFSAMMYMLKSIGKIGVQDGHVYLHKGPGFVAVDQYLTLTSKPKGQQQKAGKETSTKSAKDKAQYPYYCELCKVQGNSDVSYRSHLTGIRHRYQLVVKAVGARRSDLIQAKHNTTLLCEFDTENGTIKASGEKGKVCKFDIDIKNESAKETIAFMSCVVLKDQPAIKLSDKYDVTQAKRVVHLKPGFGCSVTVECKFRSVTVLRSPVAFAFKVVSTGEIFQILRFLVVEVSSKVNKDLPPSQPYIRPPRISRRDAKGEIIEGNPLPQAHSNELVLEDLKAHLIPKHLRLQLNSKSGIEKVAKDKMEPQLRWSNYQSKLETLLWVEEYQMEVDIRRYDMKGVVMTKDQMPKLLRLNVPGLAENRPSVLKGDFLFAHIADSGDDKAYKGYVHRIELEEVVLGFGRELLGKWVKGMKFNIEFTFNRVPIKLQHRAVEEASGNKLEPVLFPKEDKVGSRGLLCQLPSDTREFASKLFNRDLSSNTEQVKAVRHIVEGSSRPAPYLVFGPPGTGKTVTIVEAIKQVYSNLRDSYILACAPSNSAADLIAKRLISGGTPIAKTTMLRMNAASRAWATVDQELKGANICNFDKMTGETYFPNKDRIMEKRVVIVTLVTAGRMASAKDFPRDHFTHIFIDEAGHAVEPEAIISVGSLLNPRNQKGGQLVLAGDPKQLGPVLRSPLAKEHGLELSLLERLMTENSLYARKELEETGEEIYDSRVLTKLIRNYRSHPEILKLPNEMFYDNELQVHANEAVRNEFVRWENLPKKGFPIIFHGVEGRDEREGHSPSFFNLQEVQIVVEYVEELRDKRGGRKIKQSDIGIISPYRRQVQKIQQVLRKRNQSEIKVGSVEEFQGQERLIIIVSTVRSTKPEHLQLDMDYKLGFLRNPKRFNVAVTRAKALLVVIGNPYMLSKDEHWDRLLSHCVENKAYTGCHYAEDDSTLDDIIQRLDKVHLSDMAEEPKEEPSPDEPSLVAQQNDPEWRGEN